MLDYEELLCFAKAENLEDKPFKEVIELYDKHMEEEWLDIEADSVVCMMKSELI